MNCSLCVSFYFYNYPKNGRHLGALVGFWDHKPFQIPKMSVCFTRAVLCLFRLLSSSAFNLLIS